jgi:pyrroline-5-carboxylate reductase
MLELLADILAARRGYDRDLCRRMVRETMLGTLLLQESDGADASEVVNRVAHPGGPSEAGVAHLRSALPALYEAMLQKMQKW